MKRRKAILFLLILCLTLWQVTPSVFLNEADKALTNCCSEQQTAPAYWFSSSKNALPPAQIMKVLQLSLQCPVSKVHTPSFCTIYDVAADFCRKQLQSFYISTAETIFPSLPNFAIAYIFIAFW